MESNFIEVAVNALSALNVVSVMRFIDLFAGLGGFNLALSRLGHRCVFASEIDETLRSLYEKNFGLKPAGDIRSIDVQRVPEHEILCAGFPCQPFSKAGRQDGMEDPKFGDLYRYIIGFVAAHKPKYLVLENVPNFKNHDQGRTWKHIKRLLEIEGYDVKIGKLSPHRFGIPQIRERVYIVGSTTSLEGFRWPERNFMDPELTVDDYLDKLPINGLSIPDKVKRCLDVWQEFLDKVPRDEKIPNPLWSMEFGADYPYEETTPSHLSAQCLRKHKGSFGLPLGNAESRDSLMALLPSYARRDEQKFPNWKIRFIAQNRQFYRRHQTWLDEWIPKITDFPSSLQKLEWNCQGDVRRIDQYIVQIRASGVRVKRRTTAPSLVAMTATQVPIVAWEGRYMTPTECKRLQSMNDLKYWPESDNRAYEALGNAINVDVASRVIKALLEFPSEISTGPQSTWC